MVNIRQLGLLVLLVALTLPLTVYQAQDECVEDCETLNNLPNYYRREQANTSLLYDRSYRRLLSRVQVFDAPNGNMIREIAEGFNFVTVVEERDGWIRINHNEWVPASSLAHIEPISTFTGFYFEDFADDVDETVAWALVNMYPSASAGESPDENKDLIYRYTPLTISNTVELDDGRWYEVGENRWVHQYRVAKIVPLVDIPEDIDTERWVGIDLYEQVLIAYEGETPIFATLISTGLPRWPTYEGTFNIYYRAPRKDMSWGTVGDDYYVLEEVPWTMFFDDGRALHGAYWHDGFGYRRSHGCVNLSIHDAKWLYDWVAEGMGSSVSADIEEGPAVYVYSTGEYR
jgi:hypothetical protein